jgi:hypothetical protein
VENLGPGQKAQAATTTFIPPEAIKMPGYGVLASPTLYPGQTVRARLQADAGNAAPTGVLLYLLAYGPDDEPVRFDGPISRLEPGGSSELSWQIPDTGGAPVFEIGLELDSPGGLYLDCLGWQGDPKVTLGQPEGSRLPWPGPQLWRKAWINGVDQWEGWAHDPYRLIQNAGRGLLIQGTREWVNYEVHAPISLALAKAGGLSARVQGMRRFYALLLCEGGLLRLVKALDGDRTLAEAPFPWELWHPYDLRLEVSQAAGGQGVRLRAWVDGNLYFDMIDIHRPLQSGAIALVIEEGHLIAGAVAVQPA